MEEAALLLEETATDDGLGAFFGVRRRRSAPAARVAGRGAEAGARVRDGWRRWPPPDRSAVEDPPAYLATITTRLAINVLQSARTRREAYFGIWLPEPVDTSADPGL